MVASLAVLAAACSGSGGAAESTAVPTTVAATTTTTSPPVTTRPRSTTTTIDTTTTTVPEPVHLPLTGELVDDEADVPDQPALVVKIDNHPRARPQAGLNEADIVFEENVENLTRFAAVFHSDGSDPVGPIRSARHQDIHLLEAFEMPLFAQSGGNATVMRAVADADLVSLSPGNAAGFYRRSGRGGAPHNLYSSTDALRTNTPDDFDVPEPVFYFLEPDDEIDGEPASVIEVGMDGVDVRWEYDARSDRYRRWQNDQVHETELTGQVWADNVVVMSAEYRYHPLDGTPAAQTLGTNTVTVFSGGTVQTGVWLRFQPDGPFAFFDNVDDLNEIRMEPGRTWVEIARVDENEDQDVLSWS